MQLCQDMQQGLRYEAQLCRAIHCQAWLLCAPGKGSMSRQRTMTSTCLSPMSAFQSRFSTFTQISPGFETLGWKIFVRKKPVHQEKGFTIGPVPDSCLYGAPTYILSGRLQSRSVQRVIGEAA